MGQFHGLNDAVHNKGGAEAGTQPEEQHLAALIASQSLHGRVIDDLGRTPECASKIKSHPARSQMMRFGNRSIVQDRPRIAHRNHIIFPSSDDPLDAGDHLLRSHPATRRKLSRLNLPSGQDLYVRSTDIDGQHFHDEAAPPCSALFTIACASLMMLFRWASSLKLSA